MADMAIDKFSSLVEQVSKIGADVHADAIMEHALLNLPDCERSIKQLPFLDDAKRRSGIVISAGPSVRRRNSIQKMVVSGYKGVMIATDGTYIACLKAGLIPDFVLTLDPHRTRMVRWFGDHDFAEHTENDDYFKRQDLDIEFRKNSIEQNKQHIDLVNEYGHRSKAIVATSAPRNLVQRLKEAKFDMYWWNPLVDDPQQSDSFTRKLYQINKLPCMNTGGTVGTAAWVFANSILKLPVIALVGTDFGYSMDTPIEKTQTYYELIEHLGNKEDLDHCFVEYEFSLTKEKFYTDPTYFWYRKNFLELHAKSDSKTFNCTEGGTLVDDGIECITLDDFLTL